jgi:hypothetical protein
MRLRARCVKRILPHPFSPSTASLLTAPRLRVNHLRAPSRPDSTTGRHLEGCARPIPHSRWGYDIHTLPRVVPFPSREATAGGAVSSARGGGNRSGDERQMNGAAMTCSGALNHSSKLVRFAASPSLQAGPRTARARIGQSGAGSRLSAGQMPSIFPRRKASHNRGSQP